MDFFSTVEFYIIAIMIALLLVGSLFGAKTEAAKYTYFYAGALKEVEYDENEYLSLKSGEEGQMLFIHHNVKLPEGVGVNLKIDVCGENLKCIENLTENISSDDLRSYDVIFVVKCMKKISYTIEYESKHSAKWCNISMLNNGMFDVKKELKI